jgi:SNF2 family DNA or RNA helicase
METDKELDCVIYESSTTNNAQETPSAAAHEAKTAAVASECPETAMEQTPSADVKRITPSPPLAADKVARRAGWSLSDDDDDDDDDDDLGDSESVGHVKWHAQKIAASTQLSPMLIDLCNNDSEIEKSDNEYDPVSGKKKAKHVKQAQKEVKPAAWLERFDNFSDTIDNEYDPVGEKRKAKQDKRAPWSKKIRNQEPMRPLAKLSAVEKKAVLSKIESAADRALMRLLWKIGFRYTLMAHQFEGVRAVAGVPSIFPLAPETGDEFSVASARPEKVLQSFPIVLKTRGLLLADEMGLGKTVQSIGGMILRNKWYEAHMNGTRKALKRLPTLVVGPNDAVLLQWEETLLKAGVSPSRIHYFRPKRGLRFEGDIFVLLTRYNLQTEVKNLLEKVNMGNNERPTSPLFHDAPKSLLHMLKNQYQ